MKVNGLTKASDARKRIPPPFVDESTREIPVVRMGKILDGEETLDKLWASGEIDHMYSPSHSLEMKSVECIYCHTHFTDRGIRDHEMSCPSNPLVGLTEREYNTAVLGHTPAQDIRADERRISLGQTQPTAKGPRILESNVLQLRAKYNAYL